MEMSSLVTSSNSTIKQAEKTGVIDPVCILCVFGDVRRIDSCLELEKATCPRPPTLIVRTEIENEVEITPPQIFIADRYSIPFKIHPFFNGIGCGRRLLLNAILLTYLGAVVPLGEKRQGESRVVHKGRGCKLRIFYREDREERRAIWWQELELGRLRRELATITLYLNRRIPVPA